MGLLHRFSDSGLHTILLIAIVIVAAAALVKAITLTVSIWTFDPVVVHGQSKTSQQTQQSTPAPTPR